MGLDMSLSAQVYVDKYSDYRTKAINPKYTELAAKYPALDTEHNYSFEIAGTVAYWRKANQIHKWFVDKCQDGVDDCRDTNVPRETLEELLNLCRRVALEKNPDLLPPQAGFFFGSTEVGEWYWDDINLTISHLSRILDDERLKHVSFYYHSSW